MEIVGIILWPVIGLIYMIYKYLTQEGQKSDREACTLIVFGVIGFFFFAIVVGLLSSLFPPFIAGPLVVAGVFGVIYLLYYIKDKEKPDKTKVFEEDHWTLLGAKTNEPPPTTPAEVVLSPEHCVGEIELAKLSSEEKAKLLSLSLTEYEILTETLSEEELNEYLLSQLEM